MKKNKINNPKKNDFEKKIEAIKESKTTTKSLKKTNISYSDYIEESTINNSLYANPYNSSYQDSTMDSSKYNNSNLNESSNINEVKMFNSARAQFYLKHKLYDFSPDLQDSNIFNESSLEKYKINEEYNAFVYPNDLNTYQLTQSGFITKSGKKNDSNTEYSGLIFCGEYIEVNTREGIEKKKCAPNEFICPKCMEMNKNKYNIKKDYLININGRISKKNKGSYHCFGHFKIKNQIEDCITKFTCEACNLLNMNINIYFQKKNI